MFWASIRVRIQYADQSLLNLRKPRAAGLRMDLDDERGEAGERGGRSLPFVKVAIRAARTPAGLMVPTGAKRARVPEARGNSRGSVRSRRFNMRPIRTSMRTATRPSAWTLWRRTHPS